MICINVNLFEHYHPVASDLSHLVVPYTEDSQQSYPSLTQQNEYKFLHSKLSKCPSCDASFRYVDNLTVKLHLLRHYAKDLVKQVSFNSLEKISNTNIYFSDHLQTDLIKYI